MVAFFFFSSSACLLACLLLVVTKFRCTSWRERVFASGLLNPSFAQVRSIFPWHMSPKWRSFPNLEGLTIQHHIKWEFLTTFWWARPVLGMSRHEHSLSTGSILGTFGHILQHHVYALAKQAKVQRNNPWLPSYTPRFRLQDGIFWAEMESTGWLVNHDSTWSSVGLSWIGKTKCPWRGVNGGKRDRSTMDAKISRLKSEKK